MLLLKDDGSNECIFSADNLQHDWSGTNPDTAIVLSLINDASREVTNVTLLNEYVSSSVTLPAIFLEDGRLRGYFHAKYPHTGGYSGAYSNVFLLQRGYYSYKLYEHLMVGALTYPSASDLLSNTYFTADGSFGTLFNQVDNGKALVVSPTQYTEIKTGTNQNNIRTYDYLNGEVSYTEHTDKITGSQIDTDDNFIHVQ